MDDKHEKENDINNNEENEFINKFKKFEFNNLGEQSQEYIFKLNEIKAENLYLISKEDFDKGIGYLQELSKLEDDKKNSYKNKNKKIYMNIYAKKSDVKGSNKNFCLVGEDFFKSLEIDEKIYKEKYINFFEMKEKKYIFFEENNILEITKSEKISVDDKKENILKNLILIYAYEKNYDKLFISLIEDEYDINEYYLINKNWIESYKNNSYKEVKRILDNNYDFSLKGFLYNLNNIVKKDDFKNIKSKLKSFIDNKEESFYPKKNQDISKNIKDIGQDIYCPDEFILVPEFLFDFFYSGINKSKYSKDDYKYNIMINDKVVFIQDNKINSIYYTFFFHDKSELDLYYLFNYEEDITFFNEVKLYIKDKGFLNYIAERNIKYKKDKTLTYEELNKQEEEEKIGKYINFKTLDSGQITQINTLKINKMLNENEKLFSKNKEFLNSIDNLTANRIKTPNYNQLNEIIKNYPNKKFIKTQVGIALVSNINNLYDNLFFKELGDLSYLKEKNEEYEKQKEEIIKKLLRKYKDKNIEDIVNENILLFNPEDIDNDKNHKNKYNLINIELLKEINKSKEFSESILECFYFKNNDEEYILYPGKSKLYMIKNRDKTSFNLKECYINLEIIINNLKGLEENEENIKKKLELPLKELSDPEEYYCINNEWIEEYKKLYNYKTIIKNKNKDEQELYSYINAENISNFLTDDNNLIPNLIEGTDYFTNFSFINKNLYESIIKDINKSNDINLNSKNNFELSFGGKKIFLKEVQKWETYYFIYSIDFSKYKLDYILKFKKKINIKDFLSDYETFDDFIKNNEIDMSLDEEQKIKDSTIKVIKENKVAKDNKNNKEDKYKKKENIDNNKTFKKNSNQIQANKEPNHCLGLENIGATCYMNATIQCLCHVTNVKNYFQNQQLVNNDTYNKNCELTKEFNKLLNELWKEPSGNRNYYTPTDFKNCISRMNPLFRGIAANDSKDLIIFLYETMHNEINKQGQYNCNNINDDLTIFRNNYYSNNSSFLIDTFYFEQQSELCCLSCNFSKLSYNISNIIIFPLEKVREYMIKQSNNGFMFVSLENCFEYYQEKEYLSNENQIFCNNCHKTSNASTGNKLFTCPQVMTIILNRGKGLEFEVNFEYPSYINIDKYVVTKASYGTNYRYELICVLSHYGDSSMSGHFIAFCKSPVNGKWYCYNDAIVTLTDEPKSQNDGNINGIPYVLFYQRTDLDKIQKSNNNNYSNNWLQSKKSEDINNKINDVKNITLNFNYDENKYYLDVSEKIKIKDLINNLYKKYRVPKTCSILFQNQNDCIELEGHKTISDYDIQDGNTLTIV